MVKNKPKSIQYRLFLFFALCCVIPIVLLWVIILFEFRQSIDKQDIYRILYNAAGKALVLAIPLCVWGINFLNQEVIRPAKQLKKENNNLRMTVLQSQINTHFLYNTLELLNWQARLEGNIQLSKMIDSLKIILDSRLNRNNTVMAALADELKCADAYLEILSLRFSDNLQIEKNIDKTLDYTEIPYLTMQPLIENAAIHGIEKAGGGKISINIFKRDIEVIIQIINSGLVMTENEKQRVEAILNSENTDTNWNIGERKSIGIHNVNERIKLNFGQNYGLHLIPLKKGGVLAEINIPYEDRLNDDFEEKNNKLN